MSYNSGLDFGYDQIFVHPEPINDFGKGYAAFNEPKNKTEMNLMKKIMELESANAEPVHSGGYLPVAQHQYSQKDSERESIRQLIADLQRKNDMLTMFIVFLVVFIIIQYSSFNQGMYYANTLSMSRMGFDKPVQ